MSAPKPEVVDDENQPGVVSRAVGAIGNGVAMVLLGVCLIHLLNLPLGYEQELVFMDDKHLLIGNLDEIVASAGLFFAMDVLGFNPITMLRDRMAARRAARLAAKEEKQRLKLAAKAEKEAAKAAKKEAKEKAKQKG
mgnify:CR=1 FL=1